MIDPFSVREALETFRIITDTREQQTPRAKERYAAFGVPYEKATLKYGDYCGNIKVNGAWLHDVSATVAPSCVIERKMSLDELAGCLGRSRERFQREFERACANNARIYLLVENGSWEGILYHRYRSRLNTNAFLASLTAWMVRYGMSVVFCRSDTSGRLIKEILYRDMKERLQRGEYG